MRTIARTEDLADGEIYEGCALERFEMQGRRLEGIRFVDCVWTAVDLAGAVPAGCTFQGCRFEDCKASGVDWTVVKRFTACEFRRCVLDQGAFPGVDLHATVFDDCRMREVVLTGADLTGASLRGCDLSGATFGRTKLLRADLRRATGWVIHPGENAVKGMRVSAEHVAGLLEPFGIEIV